jgi:hypothetical protein
MKNYFLSAILSYLFLNASAQFPNGTFDTWINSGNYSEPTGWATTNQTPFMDSITVSEDVNGFSGSAAKLNVKFSNNFGFVLPVMELGANLGPGSGVPFTQTNVSSLQFKAKHDLMPGDTLLVGGEIYTTINNISFFAGWFSKKITGTENNFTNYTIPIMWSYMTSVDTLKVHVMIGDIDNGASTNSWAVVDEFEFIVGSPIIPDAPTNLSVQDISVGTNLMAELQWTDNSDFENYFLAQRSSNINGPWTDMGFNPMYNSNNYIDSVGLSYGTYYYRVTATNGMGSVRSAYTNIDSVTFSPPTVVSEFLSHNIKVYPNPVNSTLAVELPNVENNAVVSLLNLAAGSYLIKIETPQHMELKQVIIK